MKECKRCRKHFEVTERERLFCSLTCRQKTKQYMKNYYIENKEKIELKNQQRKKQRNAYSRMWKKIHKDYYEEYCKNYKQKNSDKIKKYREEHKEEARKYKKQYSQENKQYINESRRKYLQNPINRLISNYRSRICNAIKNNQKRGSLIKLLGCSIEQLKKHLQNQFKLGMTWKNYGKWHIDHIIPCAKFDLSKLNEQLQCFNYINLQPLWAKENLEKHCK